VRFFEKEFGCKIIISEERDPWIEDPANRASRAKPVDQPSME
jgi:hypothetical protein